MSADRNCRTERGEERKVKEKQEKKRHLLTMTRTKIMSTMEMMMILSFMFFHHIAFLSFTVDFLNC